VSSEPSRADLRRWRRHLADERSEAAVYRDLAARREGEEREILLALAEAERRHEAHWLALLGDRVGAPHKGTWRTRTLGWAARRFGSLFVLALAQRAETRLANRTDADVTPQMIADEEIHSEVIRGLARRGRQQISGSFRAAVFGANDGLVSNLALVLGIGASGVSHSTVLLTGVAGLLAGALSMGAGEYVSVSSQRELLAAGRPSRKSGKVLAALDAEANELALVYRARGMTAEDAAARARAVLASVAEYERMHLLSDSLLETSTELPEGVLAPHDPPSDDRDEVVGTAWHAASSSFAAFSVGAIVPVIPYALGVQGMMAVVWSAGLVGFALVATGAIVGVLSGSSPLWRALRQLAIGWGAAAATFALGSAFGAVGL